MFQLYCSEENNNIMLEQEMEDKINEIIENNSEMLADYLTFMPVTHLDSHVLAM